MQVRRFDRATVCAIAAIFVILGLGVYLAVTFFSESKRESSQKSTGRVSFQLSEKEKKSQAMEERFNAEVAEGLALFLETIVVIGQNYYEDIPDPKERLIYPALKEMINQLDPHSHIFFPPKEPDVCEWKDADSGALNKPPVQQEIKNFGKKKIGYLRIESFEDKAIIEKIVLAVNHFNAENVDGAVLDLRGNTGGWVNISVEVLKNFMPPGKHIFTAKYRDQEEDYFTDGFHTVYFRHPLVIMTDENTASAAEIVAGVLRDYKKAIIIGKNTYGKGSLNYPFKLSNGSILVLTTGTYFLPSGELISNKGIKPHIQMDPSDDEAMMEKAEEVLVHWKYYKKTYLK